MAEAVFTIEIDVASLIKLEALQRRWCIDALWWAYLGEEYARARAYLAGRLLEMGEVP